MNNSKRWEGFSKSELLKYINPVLNAFGWEIKIVKKNGKYIGYPIIITDELEEECDKETIEYNGAIYTKSEY